MTFTSDERREVAQALRGLDESIDERGESRPLEHDAILLRAIRAAVGRGDIFQRLADLIDRPTCFDTENKNSKMFTCSACGFSESKLTVNPFTLSFFHIKPGYRYCPNCGAEVIRDGR